MNPELALLTNFMEAHRALVNRLEDTSQSDQQKLKEEQLNHNYTKSQLDCEKKQTEHLRKTKVQLEEKVAKTQDIIQSLRIELANEREARQKLKDSLEETA